MNKRLLITGKVQGVGFRKSCLQEATRLKLKGWVRNLTDGRVEIQVSGQDTDVAALMDWAKIGPRFAKVKSVDVFESNEEIQEVFWIRGDGN